MTVSERKTVWGVLGAARIATTKVIPALQQSPDIEVRAIASRDLARAKTAADLLGIERAYDCYDALLADPDIEVIYNPLPNHLHVPMTLAAAKAGKHVLCEKPFALNAAEIDQLNEVSGNVHIMEAFMVRHSAQWNAVRDLIRRGRIGALTAIQAHFTYDNADPANIRNDPAMGGGGLYDIGCYPIVTGRYFFECEPVRGMSAFDRCDNFGTDQLATGLLDFGQGRHLSFTVGTRLFRSQGVTLFGTQGRIFLPLPFNPLPDVAASVLIEDADGSETLSLLPHNQFTAMGQAFADAVLGRAPLPYGLEDARANMRVLDALFRSEKSEGWELV